MRPVTRVALSMLLLMLTPHVSGQVYPARPVRIIVPFAAGGPTDIVARLLAQKLIENLGQQVVVDNRPGANGIVGADLVAKAPPDGYTLLLMSAGFTINATLYPRLPYDSLNDFAAVSLLSSGPSILVVHPSLPVRTVQEFVAFARRRPGQISYASAGVGSPSHLNAELLKILTGIEMIHVPYKGIAPAFADVVAGYVQASFPTILGAVPHVKSGRLRALAVTSARRSAALPDVPTVEEGGVRGYEASNWYGLAARAQAPAAVIAKLNQEVIRIFGQPDVRDRLSALGMEAATNAPREFAAMIKAEVAKWAKVIRASGAKAE